MRLAQALLFLAIACGLVTGIIQHSNPAHAGSAICAATQPMARGRVDAALSRGFNLPNWAPEHDGFKPDDALLSQLLKLGFSHIRLPFNGERLMKRFSSPAKAETYLNALEKAALRLHGLGYVVSIDMHPGDQFQHLHQSAPEKGYNLLVEAWDRISERASSSNWPLQGIYFELLNEPVPPQEIWWLQAQRLVIRLNERAKGRRLVVGPAVYQRYEPLLSADPLVGEGIVYAIHYYDPMVFTHQAMTWDESSYLSRIGQIPFPADASHPALLAQIEKLEASGDEEGAADLRKTFEKKWDAARIDAALAPVGDWARRNNVTVIINEFGVLDFDVDPWARAGWLRAVREGAERHCLGWTHWEFSDGFGMVDPKTTLPDPLVLDALLSSSDS